MEMEIAANKIILEEKSTALRVLISGFNFTNY